MEGGSKDVRVNIQEESGPDGLLAMKSSIINTVILQQQKRIAELENELQRSRQEVQRIKRSSGSMTVTPSITSADSRVGGVKTSGRPVKKKASPASRLSDTSGQPRYWTAEEHARFLTACEKYGARNYTAVSLYVGTRTPKQVRTHAQKFEVRLAREANGRSQLWPRREGVVREQEEDDAFEKTNFDSRGKNSIGSSVTLESAAKEENMLEGNDLLDTRGHVTGDEEDCLDMDIFELTGSKQKGKEFSDVDFCEDWFLNVDSTEPPTGEVE